MKLKLITVIASMALSISAFAQDSATPSTTDTGTSTSSDTSAKMDSAKTAKTDTSMTPKDICKHLVDVSNGTATDSKMNQWIMGTPNKKWLKNEVSNADCTDETIAGNHAIVVTKTGNTSRLMPFVKQGAMWKLDMQAFKTLNRMDSRMPAGNETK